MKRRLKQGAADARDLALHHLLKLLPTQACSDLGSWMAPLMNPKAYPLLDSRGRSALARIRPDLSLDAAMRRLWQNIGRVSAEYSVLGRMAREGRIEEAEPGRLRALLDDPRPAIFCFLHIGNWDVAHMAIALAAPGRMIALAMPSPSRAQSAIIEGARSRLPSQVLWMSPKVWRAVLEQLKTPGGLAYIAGDEPGPVTVATPFFGRRPTTEGNLGKMVRLAAATGARIVPIFAERLPGVRFRLTLLQAVEVAGGDDERGVLAEVVRINALIEPVVRSRADQWLVAIGFGRDVKELRAR